MNLEQEKDLIERAKGSSEAFGELYDKYYNQVLGYALRRTADIEMARDVTSEVFFKALKNIKDYRWQGVPFSHWLYRVANREIVDYYNKIKRDVSHSHNRSELKDLREELVSGRDELKKYDDYLDLHNYISKLPSKYQEVITLKYFEDMDITRVAQILHKPEGTIKSLLHRGIEKLRKMTDAGGRG